MMASPRNQPAELRTQNCKTEPPHEASPSLIPRIKPSLTITSDCQNGLLMHNKNILSCITELLIQIQPPTFMCKTGKRICSDDFSKNY